MVNQEDQPLFEEFKPLDLSSAELEVLQKEYPIRDIFQYAGSGILNDPNIHLSHQQVKAIRDISLCKTGELGYDAAYCPNCKKVLIHNVSCNNRMCPNCQALEEKIWVEKRKAETIEGISYFHAVATLPDELNPLFFLNQSSLYSLLQQSAGNAIVDMSRSRQHGGFMPGVTSVLHTAGSNMRYHPHVHMIVTGGGLTREKQFVETSHKTFFLPEKAVAAVFRGKFLEGLKHFHDAGKLVLPDSTQMESKIDLNDPNMWKSFINSLYNEDWVFFIRETYNGRGNALEYLGRYVFHTAIKNSRIISFTQADEKHPEGQVIFAYKDYSVKNEYGYAWKQMALTPKQFVLRFIQHVLPKGYSRVRYFGFLANAVKKKNLKLIAQLLGRPFLTSFVCGKSKAQLMEFFFNRDINCCPHCRAKLIKLGRVDREQVAQEKHPKWRDKAA